MDNGTKQELMDGARAGGICADGFSRLRSLTPDGLLDYYVQNPDWCMERNYPRLDFLREHSNDDRTRKSGIFIDRHFSGKLFDDRLVYIFHHCTGLVRVALNVEKELIPMLYFANGCDITVRCYEHIRIPLYILGNNDVRTDGDAKYIRHTSKIITP